MSLAADGDNPGHPITPDRRARRDAWLAEMWPTVPQYHPGDRPRPYRSRS